MCIRDRLSLAIAGIGSAWTGGCARIPFVAGLDSYMPSWLGNIHPRYGTPIYVAKAEDAWLEDVDGNRYIDFAGGIGCANAGHRQDAVVDAICLLYTSRCV